MTVRERYVWLNTKETKERIKKLKEFVERFNKKFCEGKLVIKEIVFFKFCNISDRLGIYHPHLRRIGILQRLSDKTAFRVFVHELCHAYISQILKNYSMYHSKSFINLFDKIAEFAQAEGFYNDKYRMRLI